MCETPIKMFFLDLEKKLPLVIEAIACGVNLYSWAANNREFIESHILQYGGLLFRNFHIENSSDLETLIRVVCGETLEYRERSSPRSVIAGKIYTSTEHPANQSISMHCENSYQQSWPMRIFFHCLTPATVGGETPIADTRKVLNRIRPQLCQQFIEKKVMYVRNFYEFFGLPWQTVFQTTNKADVETYCQENGIAVEWQADGYLKTRAVREPVLKHPKTGEWTWFNHMMFYHMSALDREIQVGLLSLFKPDELPNNSFYGDGTPIEDSVIEEIKQCYQEEMVLVAWQKGDVLMLDNMLVAHGRKPYSGPRLIQVGMAQLWRGTLGGSDDKQDF